MKKLKSYGHLNIYKNVSDKIQQLFKIKKISKLDTEGIYLNIIMATYSKSTANIMLNMKG